MWLPDRAPSPSPLPLRPGHLPTRAALQHSAQPDCFCNAPGHERLFRFHDWDHRGPFEVPAAVEEAGKERRGGRFIRCLGLAAETCKMGAGVGRDQMVS